METQRWNKQIQAAREMSLTVGDWRKTAARHPTRYGWALPYLSGAADTDPVAPLLVRAVSGAALWAIEREYRKILLEG